MPITSTATATVGASGSEGAILDLAIRAYTLHLSALYIALGLMLFVALLRAHPWGAKVPDDLVPWVTIAMATSGAIATGLMSGIPMAKAVPAGIAVGVSAVGGWESLGKLMWGTVKSIRGQPVVVAGKIITSIPPGPPTPPAGGAA